MYHESLIKHISNQYELSLIYMINSYDLKKIDAISIYNKLKNSTYKEFRLMECTKCDNTIEINDENNMLCNKCNHSIEYDKDQIIHILKKI
jgi:uncharacterized paraquat-inducible protein A